MLALETEDALLKRAASVLCYALSWIEEKRRSQVVMWYCIELTLVLAQYNLSLYGLLQAADYSDVKPE